jgi:hypothetical protein
MTSGFSLEIVNLPRLIRGSLSLFSGPPWKCGECFPGWFLEGLLCDVLALHRLLPTWDDEVDGLAYPLHQPTAHSYLPRGRGLPVWRRLDLSWW